MSCPGSPLRRLFFALQPAAAERQAIAALADPIPFHGARRIHPDDLHVTLLFVGGVPADRLEAIAAAAAISAPAITLTLDQLGLWQRPGILWYGPGETPAPLLALASGLRDALGEAMASCGLEPDPRPYRAHLTLARKVRQLDRGRPPPAMTLTFHEFLLMESMTRPSPPLYRVLRRYPLTGTQ
jgi:2'-5' RNA ligase